MASDTVVIWELPPPIEKLHKVRADVVVHTCNPGIWEVETEHWKLVTILSHCSRSAQTPSQANKRAVTTPTKQDERGSQGALISPQQN